jgi:hypothetical protein
MVKCPYKECGEVFSIGFDESQLDAGDTYLMNCPKCGKSIAIDVYEAKIEDMPTVDPETDTIIICGAN